MMNVCGVLVVLLVSLVSNVDTIKRFYKASVSDITRQSLARLGAARGVISREHCLLGSHCQGLVFKSDGKCIILWNKAHSAAVLPGDYDLYIQDQTSPEVDLCGRQTLVEELSTFISEHEHRYTHAAALILLSGAGIPVSSSGNCSNRYSSTCTSLDTVRQKNINDVIWLKKASICYIRVTGGTETGHASGPQSHWTGYKLDISSLHCIKTYIQSFKGIGKRKGGNAQGYQDSRGNQYYLEGDHWDILYP